jgi:trans-aconitate methyltransferase
MELSTAIKLIEQGVDKNSTKQVWADLGAGAGLFTQALSLVLPPESKIHAIDKQASVKKIKTVSPGVRIFTHEKDFVTDVIDFELLDGIVMANSLHYVHDKFSCFEKLKKNLKSTGRLIVIEYDMNVSNNWVPFPIPFKELSALSLKSGFLSTTKMYEVPSVYHNAMIYAALLQR